MNSENIIIVIALIIAIIVIASIIAIGYCFSISKGFASKATITDEDKKIEVQAVNSNLVDK